MKYVITWKARPNNTEEVQARSLEVFSKWTPESNFLQFLGRLDGEGGFAVTETDDPTTMAKDTAKFSPWFEFTIYPVMDVAETAQIAGDAVDFRARI